MGAVWRSGLPDCCTAQAPPRDRGAHVLPSHAPHVPSAPPPPSPALCNHLTAPLPPSPPPSPLPGYRFGDVPLPTPPANRTLADFQRPGVNDTAALLAAVAWANAQPESAGWAVVELPAGELTLEAQLVLTRPRTVLRGAGAGATTLRLPKSMTDLKGPNPLYPTGYW